MDSNENVYLKDIPSDTYHASRRLSSHGIMALSKSPAHFKAYLEHKREDPYDVGTLLHMILLEPDVFESKKVIRIEEAFNTKAGKALKAQAEEAGALPIRDTKIDPVIKMRDAVLADDDAVSLMDGAATEVTGLAKHPEYGFEMKIRCDILNANINTIVDVKTIQGGSTPQSRGWNVFKNKWHWQAAYYRNVHYLITGEMCSFAHISVETVPPYAVYVEEIGEAELDAAFSAMSPMFKRYADLLETEHYWYREPGITQMLFPQAIWYEAGEMTGDELF